RITSPPTAPRASLGLPEVLEPIWCQLRVAHGVLDVLVPEVMLQRPRVVAVIGKFEPAGVAEHVRMHAEWHFGGLSEPRNHPVGLLGFREPVRTPFAGAEASRSLN